MSFSSQIPQVRGVDEFRRHLGDVLRTFRDDADHADPVIFGNNRRPEAAVIPFARFRELEALDDTIEDLAIALVAAHRTEQPVVGSVADFFRAAGLDPSDHVGVGAG